jgi:hypothetical protein
MIGHFTLLIKWLLVTSRLHEVGFYGTDGHKELEAE